MKKYAHVRSGFGMIELMIYAAIIAIIALAVVPNFMSYVKRARVQTAEQTLKSLKTGIDQFNVDTNVYPQTLSDLIKKPTWDENVANKWMGPYVTGNVLTDPWGKKYVYQITEDQELPYELYSHGPEGKKKGSRINAWKDGL